MLELGSHRRPDVRVALAGTRCRCRALPADDFTALSLAAIQIERGRHLDRIAWNTTFVLAGLVLVRQALLVTELLRPDWEPEAGVADRLVSALDGASPANRAGP